MTSPVLTGTLPGVPGDVGASTRLVFTDLAGVDRQAIVYGLEQRYFDPASPTPAVLHSSALTISGFAGYWRTGAGSYNTNVVHAQLATVPVVVCSTGVQPHAGTCFALWRDDFAITAAHCFDGPGAQPRHWRVAWHDSASRPVLSITRHPDADLAALRLAPGPAPLPPFELGEWPPLGAECAAFGYSWAEVAADSREPASEVRSGRLAWRGKFAEIDASRATSEYEAADCARLRFPSLPGFSGGPNFTADRPRVAVGVTHGYRPWSRPQSLVPDGPTVGTTEGNDHLATTLADYADWIEALSR